MKKLAILYYIIICITMTGCATFRQVPCYIATPKTQATKSEDAQKQEFALCRARSETQRQIAACMYLQGYYLGQCSPEENWKPEGRTL